MIRSCEENSPTRTSRAARIRVAPCTAVHQTIADRRGVRDGQPAVLDPIIDAWPKPLGNGELALEQLAPSPYSAERIARDDEMRRPGRVEVPRTGTNLLFQRFGNTGVLNI